MDRAEANRIRAELRSEIEQLKASIAEMKEDTKPVEPDVSLGRLTRLDQMQAQEIKGATIRNLEERLSELEYKVAVVGTPLYQP